MKSLEDKQIKKKNINLDGSLFFFTYRLLILLSSSSCILLKSVIVLVSSHEGSFDKTFYMVLFLFFI
jgi:hypothetical protein